MFSILNRNQTGLQDKLVTPQAKNDLSDWALLIIDMQNDFLNSFPEEKRINLINSQLKVIEYCKNNDVPILEVVYIGHGHTAAEIQNSLRYHNKVHSIAKQENDAFSDFEFRDMLRKLKPKKLIIMGVNDYACVHDTAVSALACYYQVFTAGDLIDGERHAASSNVKKDFYAKHTAYSENHQSLLNMIGGK